VCHVREVEDWGRGCNRRKPFNLQIRRKRNSPADTNLQIRKWNENETYLMCQSSDRHIAGTQDAGLKTGTPLRPGATGR
jgi:hypothetical protein